MGDDEWEESWMEEGSGWREDGVGGKSGEAEDSVFTGGEEDESKNCKSARENEFMFKLQLMLCWSI
jgi:hypothetical protein